MAALVWASALSFALVSSAVAQNNGARGAAAPARAAPAPHFSAPAPHFAPPAARFSAPAPRFAAPHVATPMPRAVPPAQYVPSRPPQFVGPQMGLPNNFAPRALPPTGGPPSVTMFGRGVVTPNGIPPNATGSVLRGRDGAAPLQSQIPGRNGVPILRNPAFANIPTRDPTSRALAQSTFGGRFAHSPFALLDHGRHHHPFGRVIGFVGAVFWPYAYDDFLDYAFAPYAYDTFWPSAYDDVLAGIYGAYAPTYSDYAVSGYAPQPGYASAGAAYVYGDQSGAWVMRGDGPARAPALAGGARQICSGQTEGLTDFPIARIAQQVGPDQGQQALLDALRAATAEAVEGLRTACPSDLPSTPTGRLAALRARVEAMLQAVRIIDPALTKFYGALNDEQKEHFNALDAESLAAAERQSPDTGQLCSAAQAADLPVSSIEQALRLNDTQRTGLDAVKEASAKARDMLTPSCAKASTLTPTARLAQMKQRLEAMIQVLDTVQPPLASFYAALDDEQKARFNRLSVRVP